MTPLAEAVISPDDVLLCLLVGANDHATRLTGATSKIHQAVFRLKTEDPDLFADFVFNSNRLFPYCEQIDDSLNSLRWNRLISMENIGFKAYTIKDMARRVYERDVEPWIDASTSDRLKKASQAFWAELGEK